MPESEGLRRSRRRRCFEYHSMTRLREAARGIDRFLQGGSGSVDARQIEAAISRLPQGFQV